MAVHSLLSGLPQAYRLLAPEVFEGELPVEAASDCSNCPMVKRSHEPDPPGRMVFHPQLRCCTYHPVLYNFQAGRALRRGGPGAVQIRARLADPVGVAAWGIRPTDAFYAQAARTGKGGFGTDAARKCPYWVPTGLNCSVWEDRNAVCRSWFCRHDDGRAGRDYWDAVRDLLRVVQVKLCRVLVDGGAPPDVDGVDVEAWCGWYVDCADRLDGMEADGLGPLQDDGLRLAREHVERRRLALTDPIPDVLGPAVTAFYDRPEGVVLEGYTHYNPSTWPHGVFALFSVMDGTVGWREALDLAEQALGERRFTEADIREMVRLGVLESRRPEDSVPGVRVSAGIGAEMTRVDAELIGFERSFDGE